MDIGTIAAIVGFGIFIAAGVFIGASKFSRRTTVIVAGLLISTGVALVFGSMNWITPLYAEAYAVHQIFYFEGKEGKTLLAFNEGGYNGRWSTVRLSILNADTGEILGRELFGTGGLSSHDVANLAAITNDKVWLYHDGLQARDPYTGKVIVTNEQVVQKYPSLDPTKNSRSTAAVEVKTDDGYVFSAPPPNFRLKLKSFPEYTFNSTDTLFHSLWADKNTKGCMLIGGKRAICLQHVFEIDHDQAVKVLMSGHKQTYGVEMDERLNQNLKLREAFFVENSRLNNPNSLLIGHTQVDKYYYNKQFEITRIDMNGRIIWTINPGIAEMSNVYQQPEVISLHNGMVYITIKGRILAFDAITGTKKWERQL